MSDRAIYYVCVTVLNLAVLCGAAYLIGWHGWSAWWALAVPLLLHRPSKPA